MSVLLAGVTIELKDGTKVDAGEYLKDKMVGLYFSASWCPPCRRFTPELKSFYESLKKSSTPFEIVYVSRDREQPAMLEYYEEHHGAWPYIPFGDEKIQELLTKFEVKTIPTFRIIKPDGTVVVKDARTEVEKRGEKTAEELHEEWEAFYM